MSDTPRFTRRAWTILLGVTPLLAQVSSTSQTAPPPQAAPSSPEKAAADVRQISDRLAQLEVPLNVEPAFQFHA